jgi:4-amino-4-deoxy-L-arabinose transferase-like glycosyltransferase
MHLPFDAMTGRWDARPRAAASASAWVLVAAVAGIWFLALGARHLLPFDEGRYAEIAREMYASGDWVTIRYNGLKYFEKPPLQLWMTALAYHAFGIGEWQARLWGAICGAAGVLMTMVAARRWFGAQAAVLAGLVLLATPSWNIASHFNSLDIGVSGALACVLAALLLAQHPEATHRGRRAWMAVAWSAMAVAVLTKGLIGIVLPGLALVVYALLARDPSLWRRLHLLDGVLLVAAIPAPWFVLVSWRNPEFPRFFFIHEHLQRYTTSSAHAAPLWYFVPQVLGGFLPWLGVAPRIATVVRDDARHGGFKPALLAAAWAGSIFVFFSLSQSKLPGYIVPVFPALALLAARALADIDGTAWNRQVLWMLTAAALALFATPWVGRLPSAHDTPNILLREYASWLAAACALAVAGLWFAHHLDRSGRLRASIAAYALALFVAATVALAGHETLGRSASGIDLVPAVEALLTPAMPIYSVRLLDHTLPFYLRHVSIMVEAPGELEFGAKHEPQKWLPTLDAFLRRWSAGPRALAIMSQSTYASLLERRVAMHLVAQDRRRVVVANFEPSSP